MIRSLNNQAAEIVENLESAMESFMEIVSALNIKDLHTIYLQIMIHSLQNILIQLQKLNLQLC